MTAGSRTTVPAEINGRPNEPDRHGRVVVIRDYAPVLRKVYRRSLIDARRAVRRAGRRPQPDPTERLEHKPRPIHGGRYGKLIGYVCECCDTVFTVNMRPTGPRLANQPPPDAPALAHTAPHRAPQIHHWSKEWGRENRKHAARVAAR